MSYIIKRYEEQVNSLIEIYQNPPNVTYYDIKYSLPYLRDIKAKHNIHNGQRKLFLSELEYLSLCGKGMKYVIYAGAAPSWKIYYLSLLFPDKKFVLIDPNPFEILYFPSESHKKMATKEYIRYLDAQKPETWIPRINGEPETHIHIINDYYSMKTSEHLKTLMPALFISDIRTSDDEFPSDLEIMWNSSQQINWVAILKPKFYMLKFRVPYSHDRFVPQAYQTEDFDYSKALGIDFMKINEEKNRFVYLTGDIYLQDWAGNKSTEMRLIGKLSPEGKIITRDYNKTEFEEKLFYFNTVCRPFGYYSNENSDEKLGFDHCQDCALENYIWKLYISSQKLDNFPIIKAVKTLCRYTRRSLFASGHAESKEDTHGYMFSPTKEWYIKQLKESIPINLTSKIPKRIENPKINEKTFNFDMMIADITNKMPISMKLIYVEEINKLINTPPEKPMIEYKDLYGSFPTMYGLNLFRSCIAHDSFSRFILITQVLTNDSYKYFVAEGDSAQQYYSDACMQMLVKMFGVIIIRLQFSKEKKMTEIPTRPGVYYFSGEVLDYKEILEIADQTLLMTMNDRVKDQDICQFSANILSNEYTNIMKIKPKAYITSLLSYMDAWCTARVNFNSPFVQEAKALGYDMEKIFKQDKRYSYLNGQILLIPYGKFLTSNYLLYGKTKDIKMVEYDINKMNDVGFYRNALLRTFKFFENRYAIPELGFDHCMDCAHASYTLEQYAKSKDISNIAEFIYDIIYRLCKKNLLSDAHGLFFNSDRSNILKMYHNELLTRTLMRSIKGGSKNRSSRNINSQIKWPL